MVEIIYNVAGFVLLQLRSARWLRCGESDRQRDKERQMELDVEEAGHTWHRLVGLRAEYRPLRPELALALHIREGKPAALLGDGDGPQQTYRLSCHLEAAHNLNLLPTNDRCRIRLTFGGVFADGAPFSCAKMDQGESVVPLDELLEVRLRCSPDTLVRYRGGAALHLLSTEHDNVIATGLVDMPKETSGRSRTVCLLASDRSSPYRATEPPYVTALVSVQPEQLQEVATVETEVKQEEEDEEEEEVEVSSPKKVECNIGPAVYMAEWRVTDLRWLRDVGVPRSALYLKFLHPTVDTVVAEQYHLEDVVPCRVRYVCTRDEVGELLDRHPPRLLVVDGEAGDPLAPPFNLRPPSPNTLTEGSCRGHAAIVTDEVGLVLCELQLRTRLELELELEPGPAAFVMPGVDDSWRRVCEQRLHQLNERWEGRRVELEQRLRHGLDKCRTLSDQLTLAVTRFPQSHPAHPQLIEMKVTEMLEREMRAEVVGVARENERLAERCARVEEEAREARARLEAVRKTSLTGEQTAGLLRQLRLLEERLCGETAERTRLQDQLARAATELHQLKANNQRNIQLQITRHRSELSRLSLQAWCKEPEPETEQEDPPTDTSSCGTPRPHPL